MSSQSTEDQSLLNSIAYQRAHRPTYKDLNELRQTKQQIQFNPVFEQSSDSIYETLKNLDATPKVILYRARWMTLLIYSFALICTGVAMATTQSITSIIAAIYDISAVLANTCNFAFFLMYIPFNFVAIKLIDRFGLRVCVCTGIIITITGCWLRCLVNITNFYVFLGATFFTAMGQPMILSPLCTVVTTWFGDKERAIATACGTIAIPIGSLICFLLPAYIFEESDADNYQKGKEHFFLYLVIQSSVITLFALPVLLFFKSKPLSPPSIIAENAKYNKMTFCEAFRSLISNRDYMILFCTFNFIYGNYSTFSSSMSTITSQFQFTVYQNAILCSAFLIGGIINSFIMGFILDAYRNYKKLICILCIGSASILGLEIFTLTIDIFYLEIALLTFLGAFTVPITCICYSFACELAYPVPEHHVLGGMISTCLIWSIILGLICQIIPTYASSYFVFVLWAGLATISGFSSFCIKEDLKRLEMDEVKNSTYIEESGLMKQSIEFRTTVFDTMNIIGADSYVRKRFKVERQDSTSLGDITLKSQNEGLSINNNINDVVELDI